MMVPLVSVRPLGRLVSSQGNDSLRQVQTLTESIASSSVWVGRERGHGRRM